jgi:hypothetical protein
MPLALCLPSERMSLEGSSSRYCQNWMSREDRYYAEFLAAVLNRGAPFNRFDVVANPQLPQPRRGRSLLAKAFEFPDRPAALVLRIDGQGSSRLFGPLPQAPRV